MEQEGTPIAQAELSIPQRLLGTVRYLLASIEGVEPGDSVTAQALQESRGLKMDEDPSFLEKALYRAFKAFQEFKGDGSRAHEFFGRRVELSIEDRGLFVLSNLVSTFILEDH